MLAIVAFCLHDWTFWGFIIPGLVCLAYCLRLELKHHGYKKRAARIWAVTLFSAGLLGSLAYWFGREQTPPSSPNVPKPPANEVVLASLPLHTRQKWAPPELPADCETIIISFGGNDWFVPVSSLKKGIFLRPMAISGVQMPPFDPVITNNRVYLKTSLYAENKDRFILMNNDLDSQIPSNWDRNYTNNVFEVVDDNKLPVLQVIYDDYEPNRITVNGAFLTTNGLFVGFESGFDAYSIHFLQSGQSVEIPDRRAIFKYPSWLHQEEFAN